MRELTPMKKKILDFLQEIGSIFYVGGILSHIIMSALFSGADVEIVYGVCLYKEMSAYILILPGLFLKIVADLLLFFYFKKRENWLKLKMLMMTFLSINGLFFLVPMMPEMVQLAKQSLEIGHLSQEFLSKEHTEQIIGQLNALPLLVEIILGSFKPKFKKVGG